MIHVLEIPAWYKSDEHPVSATFNEDHARMLLDNGLKVGVIFPNYSGSFKKRIQGKRNESIFFVDKELPTTEIKLHPYLPFFTKINYDLLFNYFCNVYEKYIETHGKPDIIHAHHCYMAGYLAMRLKRKYGLKFVLTKLSTPFIFEKDKLSSFEKKYIKKILDSADAVIYISEYQKNEMINQYEPDRKNIQEVIYLPLNDVFLEQGSRSLEKDSKKIKLINIGKLIDTKHQKLLIKAFNQFLEKTNFDSELLIFGKGPLFAKLKEQIDELGLNEKVKLLGEADRLTIRDAIANSTYLVSSSRRETMGVNFIEGHSQGIPVIALNAGTTAELINGKNGVHVVNRSPENLCEGIIEATKRSFDRKHIRESCLEKFSSDAIFDQTLSLYKNVLNL